jgi:hypothetical protein
VHISLIRALCFDAKRITKQQQDIMIITELKKDFSKGAKVLTSTWDIKKKASGRFRK